MNNNQPTSTDPRALPPVVPGYPSPAETAAVWGQHYQSPLSTERPWVSPGPAPWGSLTHDIGHTERKPMFYQGRRRKGRNWTVPLVLAALIVVILGVAALSAQRQNLLPAGVPLIGMDSGVAACKAINEGGAVTGATGGEELTVDQYREVRQVFADSRYPAIRDNGVKLIDTAWQVQNIPAGEEMGALVFIGALTGSYAGLSGGCAEQGYAIPPLNAS